MSSSPRRLSLLVPGLLILFAISGAPQVASAAPPRGGGSDSGTDGGTDGGTTCKKCSPDAGTDAGTPDAGYDAGTPDAGSGTDAGTPDAGSGTDAGTPDAGSDAGTPPTTSCLAGPVLQSLGKDHMMVGAQGESSVMGLAPFDIRYMYLAGGLFDSTEPCTSCLSCTAAGQSCSSSNPNGCGWHGCWQWDQLTPGQHLRDFLSQTLSLGQLPMITYYEILHTSRVAEGAEEVASVQRVSMMQRYFNDWRFVLKQIGNTTVLLHIEPDFWGFAQKQNSNPHLIPAAVASANPTDCANQENSVAGMGRCMIAMVRKYAPNARVGLQASSWASATDSMLNTNTFLDVEAEARKVADFLLECGGGQGDYVAVEAADRDAQWYQLTQGRNRWWDATNTTLPHFKQAFRWVKALSERMGKPNLWWQLPVGNMTLPGYEKQWKDNRLDYFFDHPEEVSAAHGLGMVFGAGELAQTNPATDNTHLVNRTNAYFFTGGQSICTSSP